MNTYFSLDRIKEARKEAKKYFLITPYLESYSDREVQKVCNGVGTDFSPKILKIFFRTFCRDAETCSIFHDIEWDQSAGYRHFFELSNENFRMNLKILAISKYRWYNFSRYWNLFLSRVLYSFLKLGYLNYLRCYLESNRKWKR